jgi:hypothetical protein
MSLINDAIKRAGQTPAPPPSPSATTAGMRPVDLQRPQSFPWVLIIAILTPVFGLAVWFIVKGWELSKTPKPVEVTINARAQATVAPAEVPPPAPIAIPQTPPVASNPPPAMVVQAPVVPTQPPKPTFPSLKLQGIFWRPSKPSAVINAKTVYVGDRLESARVTGIDRESVTVQWESETKVLTLQ